MNEWGFNATKEPIAGLLKVIQDFKNPNINSKIITQVFIGNI